MCKNQTFHIIYFPKGNGNILLGFVKGSRMFLNSGMGGWPTKLSQYCNTLFSQINLDLFHLLSACGQEQQTGSWPPKLQSGQRSAFPQELKTGRKIEHFVLFISHHISYHIRWTSK